RHASATNGCSGSILPGNLQVSVWSFKRHDTYFSSKLVCACVDAVSADRFASVRVRGHGLVLCVATVSGPVLGAGRLLAGSTSGAVERQRHALFDEREGQPHDRLARCFFYIRSVGCLASLYCSDLH